MAVKYYLGVPVVPTKPGFNGWIWCRWPDGREFLHWAAQLSNEEPEK